MAPLGATDCRARLAHSTLVLLTEASLEMRISLRLMLSYSPLKKSWQNTTFQAGRWRGSFFSPVCSLPSLQVRLGARMAFSI